MRDLFSMLDPGQLRAVKSDSQHILCLAGAGSGKTRVLTSRIFYLVKEKEIEPENILAITFTRNAAREMRERLLNMGIDSRKMWCQTFHSAAFRILRENFESAAKLKVVADIEQGKVFKNCIERLKRDKNFALRMNDYLEENNWPEYLLIEQAIKVIKECKSRSITVPDLVKRIKIVKDEEVREFYRLVFAIFSFYQKFMFKNNIFDFEDFINKAIDLLEGDKKTLKRYQKKFKYILVDEFQDVNFTQVRFLDLLNYEKNNLFVVGDDWQSIYGWRGGDVNYILRFRKKYGKNCKAIVLPYNYRSDGNIVQAASKMIRKNRRQYRKKIKNFHEKKAKIRLVKVKNNKEEIKFVLRKIREFVRMPDGHECARMRKKADKKLISRLRARENKIMIIGRNWKVLAPYIERLDETKIFITTIHGAKGMEKDIVFIVGLHAGRHGFPHVKEDYEIMKVVRDAGIGERLAEERRCFYVAVTRAKKVLYLMTVKDKESRFVREIPRRFVRILTPKG